VKLAKDDPILLTHFITHSAAKTVPLCRTRPPQQHIVKPRATDYTEPFAKMLTMICGYTNA